jgi:DNA-binding CsgD family transcriptional regulator
MESMLCPVLIGRSAEQDALIAALDAAAGGNGRAVFITGDAGIGKTRLAKDVANTAFARGFQILTGRGTESTVPVPYRPVAEALMGAARAGLVPDSPGLADYRAALGSLVPEWSHPGDADAEISPVILGEAVLRILTCPGWKGGLLVLEDLHWADPETLAIVEYLADNIAGTNVLCLATQRDTEMSPSAELLNSAAARRVATRIDVPRLTPNAVAKMAAACLAVPEVPAEVNRLLADCDGLPFAVEEILAAAVTSGELVRDDSGWHVDSDVATGVPESIVGSVRARLAALGAEVTNVVVSAAILGRQFDWTLLPAIAGVPSARALDALQRAREVQLIEPVPAEPGTFRFRHSLTRDAIISSLLPPDLAARSAAAAAAIEEAHPGLPDGWCELTAELYATAGQAAAAARLLLTAGRRALRQGAIGSAIVALDDARKLLPQSALAGPMLAIEIDEVLASALAISGDYGQLARLAEDLIGRLAAAGADPRREALIRLLAASTRPEDNLSAAAEHLAAAAAVADHLDDIELASRIEAVAAHRALATGDLDQAEELARRALAAADQAGLSGWAADVGLESLTVLGRRERTRDQHAARAAFERVRQIAEEKDLGAWRIRAMHELGTLDMLESGSIRRLAQARELAHRTGIRSVATLIELQLANIWSLGTDLDQAQLAAGQCQRSAAQISSPRIEAMALCLQANIAAVRTDRQGTELAVRRAEDLMPDDPEILFATRGQARVLAALFRADVPQAVRDSDDSMTYGLRALEGRRQASGFYSVLQAPLLAPRRALALHALLQAVCGANGRDAVYRARAAGAATSWSAACLIYAEAVLEGRCGHGRRATALADEAAGLFAPFAPWWNHLVRWTVAPAALADGWGQPVAWLREAAREFEATSHDRLASACRGLLRRAGERVPRAGRGTAEVPQQMRRLGVTSREMDVYLLVAHGYSNSDIAARLYISPKTVETHVASLVAKTGQSGRRELVAHAARFARSGRL